MHEINISSLNLHSFKKSGAYLKQCLQKYGGIWFSQELWLAENQLKKLHETGCQFTARSGMEDSVSRGVFKGRPYGGVSISWDDTLNQYVIPLSNYRHKRVVGIEFKSERHNIILISVYMPFYDSSKKSECMSETIDAISMIETIINDFPSHCVIIGGDLNTEMKGTSPFDSLWSNHISKHSLSTCDTYYPSDTITYQHQSLGHKKWLDHFVSSSLLENSTLSNHIVIEDGDNLSDHSVISMSLKTKLNQHKNYESENSSTASSLKWEKLN